MKTERAHNSMLGPLFADIERAHPFEPIRKHKHFGIGQCLVRIALARLLEQVPEELRNGQDGRLLLGEADDKVCNIVHLIYRARPYEGLAKDFEFSRHTMEEHWRTGYNNARQTLAHPEVLQLPDRLEGVRTFDCGEERC